MECNYGTQKLADSCMENTAAIMAPRHLVGANLQRCQELKGDPEYRVKVVTYSDVIHR